MRIIKLFCVAICVCLFFFLSCKNDDNNSGDKGILRFKTSNPLFPDGSNGFARLMSVVNNPALTGDTTATLSTEFMICFVDIWVSTGVVKAGVKDTLEWIKLTSVSNYDHKFFHAYTFPDVELPAGEYKSIKVQLKNIFWRYCQLVDDPTVAYELLETMGSWTDTCDVTDTTTRYNFFGPAGNYFRDINDEYVLASDGEKVAGFVIEPNKTAIITWRLGAGATEPCTTYLIDENGNREWDCGIDRMHFVCPPGVEYMWDFVVDYE